MRKIILPLLLFLVLLSACELVGDIFAAGYYAGIFVVFIVILLILFLIGYFRRK